MQPSRHYFLIAPALLALACNGGGDTTAGASASESSSSSSSSSTSEPGGTTTTTTGNPTTSGTDSGTSTSTGEPGTSSTTGDDSDSTSSTGTPPAQTCDGTEDCDGGFCWATYDGQMGEFLCSRECVANAGTAKAETQWCADSAACCSGEATCDNVGYCQLGGDTTSDTDTSTGTDTDTDTGTGTETDTDTSSSSSSGTDTDTGGGELKIEISGLMVIANCMPAVPPDPVHANWTLVVDNTQGAVEVTADVAAATLTYSPGNMEFVQKIEVDPITSGPVAAGDSSMTMMEKMQALDDLPMDCEQCDKPVVLALTLDVDGQEVPVSAEATLECVF